VRPAVYGGPLLQAASLIHQSTAIASERGRRFTVALLPLLRPNHLESGVRRVVVVTAADHDDDDDDDDEEEEEEVPMIGGPRGRSSIRGRALGRVHNAPG